MLIELLLFVFRNTTRQRGSQVTHGFSNPIKGDDKIFSPESPKKLAEIISKAAGHAGTNLEYFQNLRKFHRYLFCEIEDDHLEEIFKELNQLLPPGQPSTGNQSTPEPSKKEIRKVRVSLSDVLAIKP